MKRIAVLVLLVFLCSMSLIIPLDTSSYEIHNHSYGQNNLNFDLSLLLGGNGDDFPSGIALDAESNFVLVYTSISTNINTSENSLQTEYGGGYDCVLVKLSPVGELLFATYLGGSDDEGGRDVWIDSQGNIIVAGFTKSDDFPITEGVVQENYSGGTADGDAFIAKLSTDGQDLLWATYLGGTGDEHLTNMVIDSQDNIIVTGRTLSSDYPTTSNAFQDDLQGNSDAFVTMISPDGTSLLFSSYLGGFQEESGAGIGLDSEENIILAGLTASDDFPTNTSCVQPLHGGVNDAYIAKVDPNSGVLICSTYLGASSDDLGVRLTVGDNDEIVVIGFTTSTDFPVTVDAFQSENEGDYEAFISILDANCQSLDFSSYLGGSRFELGSDVAFTPNGDIIVTGRTTSNDFPTKDSFQEERSGGTDAYLTRIRGDNYSLAFSTYVGGSSDDFGWNLVVGPSGEITLAGWSDSTDFPTIGSFFGTHNGGADVFLCRFTSLAPESDSTQLLVIITSVGVVIVLILGVILYRNKRE